MVCDPLDEKRSITGKYKKWNLKTNKNVTGELVFGVARIFASFNDTFVHVTDLRFVSP
jgi:ribosomal protein S11